MSSSANLLSIRDVAVRRGDRRLIEGLSFTLAPRQTALVVGPNGSGKTSFLRILSGLAPCTDGVIEFNGWRIGDLLPEQRAQLFYRGHLDGLKKELSVHENLALHAGLRGYRDSFDGVLDELRLTALADRQVRYLSAGQRRRVGLATLRMARAKLWILDEPMTNLDEEGRRLVVSWIEAHVAAGGLAVVATHQPESLSGRGALLIEI